MSSAPGNSREKPMSLVELFETFPDEATARKWFEQQRWPDGNVRCHACRSDNVQHNAKHPTMTHRCRSCKKFFSVKSGTAMHGSKLSYRVWAMAIYLITTSNKGVSSLKLHRDLGISQKTAWHLAHRLRKGWDVLKPMYDGETETDEAYVGGKERNKHAKKKLHPGGGGGGKTVVLGLRNRPTGKVHAEVARLDGQWGSGMDSLTLRGFIRRNIVPGAKLYTDSNKSYRLLREYDHAYVNHSKGEYVRGAVHTNGVESLWALLKRGIYGTYHQMSRKHLPRYICEFTGRLNSRDMNTMDQMAALAQGLKGKRLPWAKLVA